MKKSATSKDNQYRSPLTASIHETGRGLTAAGVMDKQTLRELDELCLKPAMSDVRHRRARLAIRG